MPLPFRLSRRSLLKAAARLGVAGGLTLLGIGGGERGRAQEASEEPFFRESGTTLRLGNRFYEVDFDSRNGAITRIFDKRGGGVVSEGNADGSLWAIAPHEGYFWPSWPDVSANRVSVDHFRRRWESESNTLILQYAISQAGRDVQVTVSAHVTHEPYLDLTARVDHRSGPRIDWFSFPHELSFPLDQLNQAAFPKLPGILFQRSWFAGGHSDVATYPGDVKCGNLTWVDNATGSIAVYTLAPEQRAPVMHGFRPDASESPRSTRWVHQFALGIEAGDTLTTVPVRIAVGQSLPNTIHDYRQENGINGYDSVRVKLGDRSEPVLRSPLLKMDSRSDRHWGQLISFDEYSSMLAYSDPPALLHPVAFQELGFDRAVPDWWPPNPLVGGIAGYRNTFRTAQRNGSLLVPYTNPTIMGLPSLTHSWLKEQGITAKDVARHEPNRELARDDIATYNFETDQWESDGAFYYVLSPSSPQIIERLALLMELHNQEQADLILEDQHGARPWQWDFNDAATNPRSYASAWLDYTRKYQTRGLMTEGGDDRLAETQVGFFGTMLTWDYFWLVRGIAPEDWTYYPMSAMMLRDKTALYQHDLFSVGPPTTTDSLRMLRWNLAYGHHLNFDLQEYDNPWLPVVTAFSHHVLGGYAGELLREWSGEQTETTTSLFTTASVTANWTDRPHPVGKDVLVPGGVVAAYYDGSVTGGVFQRYNGHDLAPGEHYLIEQRKPHGIVVRQPMGTDTPLRIRALDEWSAGLNVAVNAFHRNGELLHRESARTRGSNVEVSYSTIAGGQVESRRFEGSITLGRDNVSDGIELVEPLETSIVVERQGREARGFASREDWKPLAFRLTRAISSANEDVQVSVEYIDENPISGREDESLHLAYVSRDNPEADIGWWDGPDTSGQLWKTHIFRLNSPVFDGRQWGGEPAIDFTMWLAPGYYIGKVTVTNADELERRTVSYYTIHDPTQGETLTQGLHLRGWTDATQPIADLNLDGLAAIYAWDAEDERWLMYSPHVPTSANTLDTLEQGRAYYVRVANGRTLHWPEAPYGGTGFLLQPGRNLVCWLGTPDKPLTDAIAPLRGMKAEPLVSVQIDGQTYDVEESRSASEPLAYGQALWVEIDAVGPTRWLQF